MRVQPISRAEEDGNDEDQLLIGQQEDLEGTLVRRVLSDDALPLTQVLPAFPTWCLEGWCPRGFCSSFRSKQDRSEDGDETQFAHHGVENHRRLLVVKVAPNVVDATAVELPSSPHASVVNTLEFDLSVPAFDPLESDEGDEFETGVPIVPGPVSAPSWVTRNRFAALQSFDHADEAPLGDMEFDLTRQDPETDGAPQPDNEVVPPTASLCNALEFDLTQDDYCEVAGDTIAISHHGRARAGGARSQRRFVLILQDVPASVMDGVDPDRANTESAASVPSIRMTPQKKTKHHQKRQHDFHFDDKVEEDAPFRLPGTATLRGASPRSPKRGPVS